MDRKNTFYKQLVTDTHVDTWFDLAEAADRNLALDIAMFGVVAGLSPSYTSGSSITVTKGRAYDQAGRRINAWSDGAASKSVSLTTATDTTPTAVSGGQERWISVFAKHGRLLQDPQTDGYAATVYYDIPEGLNATGTNPGWDQFLIVAGTAAATGTATRPALLSDAVLVCDFKRTPSDASNVLDTTRRQAWVNLNEHIAGTAGKHNASAILLTGINAWLDGLANADTDVGTFMNTIIAALADAVGSTADGASRVGAAARGGMSAGSVASQLLHLVTNSALVGVANAFSALQTMQGGLTVDGSAGADFKVLTNIASTGALTEAGVQFKTDADAAPAATELLPILEAPAGASLGGARLYMGPHAIYVTINARLSTFSTTSTWVSDYASYPSLVFALHFHNSGGSYLTVGYKAATGSAWNASAWDRTFHLVMDGSAGAAVTPLVSSTNKTTLDAKTGVITVNESGGLTHGPYYFGGHFLNYSGGTASAEGYMPFRAPLASSPIGGTVTAGDADLTATNAGLNGSPGGLVGGVDPAGYGFRWVVNMAAGPGATTGFFKVSFTD